MTRMNIQLTPVITQDDIDYVERKRALKETMANQPDFHKALTDGVLNNLARENAELKMKLKEYEDKALETRELEEKNKEYIRRKATVEAKLEVDNFIAKLWDASIAMQKADTGCFSDKMKGEFVQIAGKLDDMAERIHGHRDDIVKWRLQT